MDYDLLLGQDSSALYCLGQNAQHGVAAFHMPCFTERAWTKRELADALGADDAMLDSVQAAGAEAALFEMRIPSNYGATYTDRFRAAFTRVAEAEDAVLIPFLLADIAEDPEAFLDDGIHPSAQAQPGILEAVWPHLAPMLGASKSGSDRN